MHHVEQSSWRRATGSLVAATLAVVMLLALATPALGHNPQNPNQPSEDPYDPPPEHVPGPQMKGYVVRTPKVLSGFGNQPDQMSELYEVYVDGQSGGMWKVGERIGFDGVTGIAFSPDGTLYGIDTFRWEDGGGGGTLITIDPSTGVGTAVGPLGVAASQGGLTFDCDGNLWMAGSSAVGGRAGFFRVDPSSGAATQVGPTVYLTGLAAKGDTVFGLGENRLYTIDTSTGLATRVGPLTHVSGANGEGGGGLSFSSDGSIWGISDHLFTADANSGSARPHEWVGGYYEGVATPEGPLCSEPTSAAGAVTAAPTSGTSSGPTEAPDEPGIGAGPGPQAGAETSDDGEATVPSGGSGGWRVADRSPTGTGVATGGAEEVEDAGPAGEIAASRTGAADAGDPSGSGAGWVALVVAFVVAGLAALGVGGWSRFGVGR